VSRYALNLPARLKQEAEDWARSQGVSLNQFILWAVAEKVGMLSQILDDPSFPGITYRRGAAGRPTPYLRGTGIRVQTLVAETRRWQQDVRRAASEHDLPETRVREALNFYEAHRSEVDAALQEEQTLEAVRER